MDKTRNRHIRCKPMVCLPLIVMMFLPVMLFAQQQEEEAAASDQEEVLPTELIINHDYEDRLSRLFSNYFNPATYFINVRSTVVREQVQVTDMRVPESVRLPGLPLTLSNAGQVRDQMRSPFESPADRQKVNILNNEITIIADTSHTAASRDFMQRLAITAIPFYPERGDQVNVLVQAFPPWIKDSEPIYVQLAEPLSSPQPIQVIMPEESPEQRASIPSHVWIAIGLLILLLAFLLILYYIYSRGKTSETAVVAPSGGKPESINIYQETSGGGGGGERAVVLPDRILEPEKRPEPDHRTYLIGLFMERPIELASLMERWIKLDEEKGSLKAAQLINNVDARFMMLVEKYMSKNAFEKLREAGADPASREKYETYEDYRDITREIRQALRDGTASGLKEYEFIQFVDNEQLLVIAHNISDHDLALLLRHLTPKRSAWLLEMIGTERARNVMSFISQNESINYETFRSSAGKIFEKYFSMQEASVFTKRDIDNIMNTIEEIPISKQEEYLSMLSDTAPALHESISKRIITWERIMMVDDQILKEAIEDIDSRTIAAALHEAPSYLEDVLLTMRPEREQTMIRDIMQEETPSPKEVEQARRRIISALKEIKDIVEQNK